MQHVVIIGNGISGITCARYVRKLSDHRITIISSESDHFFSRTALMYIYMGHMKYEHTKPYEDWFWAKNRLELVRAHVEKLDTAQKKLRFADGRDFSYDVLVLATGSVPNKMGWKGQELTGVQGLYSLPDLERMETHTNGIARAVIVGGGLIGIEMAEMLLSRKIPVTFLVRENHFWGSILPAEEGNMINHHIRDHHVDLRLSTEHDEIRGDASGRVTSVVTKTGETIPCQFVGLTIGVRPNIAFLTGSGVETNRGVLVNDYFETSVPDVYAIGDCVQYRTPIAGRKPIEQIWYTGRIHGETVAYTICGKRRAYNPGVWFNSAKLFDVEYQIYGTVPAKPEAGYDSLFWPHPDGTKSIRIVYRTENMAVVGFNLLGIRYRQEICSQWIAQQRPLAYVMQHLEKANFDPEFFTQYEDQLVNVYNAKFPQQPVRKAPKKNVLTSWLGM